MINLMKKKYGKNLGVKGDRSLGRDSESIFSYLSTHGKKVNYKQSKIWVASLLGIGTDMEKNASDDTIALCISSLTGTVYTFSKRVHRQLLALLNTDNVLGLKGKKVVEPFDWVSVTVGDKFIGDAFSFLNSKNTLEWDLWDMGSYEKLVKSYNNSLYVAIIPDTMWKDDIELPSGLNQMLNTVPFAKFSVVGNNEFVHILPTISILGQINLLQLTQYHLGSYLTDYMEVYNSLSETDKKKYLAVDSPKPDSVLSKIRSIKKLSKTAMSTDAKIDYIKEQKEQLVNQLTKIQKSIESPEMSELGTSLLDYMDVTVDTFHVDMLSDKKVEILFYFSIKPSIVSKAYSCPELTWINEFDHKLSTYSLSLTNPNYGMFLNILYDIEPAKVTQTVSVALYEKVNMQAILSTISSNNVGGLHLGGNILEYLRGNIAQSAITPKESNLGWLIENAGSMSTDVALGFNDNQAYIGILTNAGVEAAFTAEEEWSMSGAMIEADKEHLSVVNKDTSLFKRLSLTSMLDNSIKYELVLNTGLLGCEPEEMVISYRGTDRVCVAISALFEVAKDKILLLSKDV